MNVGDNHIKYMISELDSKMLCVSASRESVREGCGDETEHPGASAGKEADKREDAVNEFNWELLSSSSSSSDGVDGEDEDEDECHDDDGFVLVRQRAHSDDAVVRRPLLFILPRICRYHI